MKRHYKYLKYVLRHKWYVFLACFRMRVPLWIAILHDWDKFMPDEWFPYARTFYKLDGTKQYVESVEFARAWMFHQHRNKHHWQYWIKIPQPQNSGGTIWEDKRIQELDILVWDRGEAQQIVQRNSGGDSWYELRPVDVLVSLLAKLKPQPMPDVYRREMIADWMGAGKALGKPKVWEWYEKNSDKIQLHADTRAWVDAEIEKLKADYALDQKGQMWGYQGASWFD
jgi:hypothetical protein